MDSARRPPLDRVLSNITPNWYASVMGTGIVAVAAASLPWQPFGLHAVAVLIWLLAAAWLVVVTAATVGHWASHPATARGHLRDPIMGHFYGAPPMALLTVGAGTILLGRDVLGLRLAVDIDWALWLTGTVTGLLVAGAVPYLMLTRARVTRDDAFGGWLMPVVPPMVSASTGALLVPHAPSSVRVVLLLSCYAMFGLALAASIVVIGAIVRRLAGRGIGEARLVPTLWIVLGPLGQSITAANLLGAAAHQVLPPRYAGALRTFALVYSEPVWGLALVWAGFAVVVTARIARDHLPFSLSWWSFTFPVGTLVTGTTGLALHTGLRLFTVMAGLLYAALVAAWAVVASRTVRAARSGALFPAAASTRPARTLLTRS